MLVVMQEDATDEQIQNVIDRMVALNFTVHAPPAFCTPSWAVLVRKTISIPRSSRCWTGVKEAHRIASPYKLASRSFRPGGTVVRIKGVEIGGNAVVAMAGPCSVENARPDRSGGRKSCQKREQRSSAAARSSRAVHPTAFRVLGKKDLRMLREAADRHKLLVVSEVMDQTQIPLMRDYVDIFQVGARNMQNFTLLRELGKTQKAGAAEARHRGDHRGTCCSRQSICLSGGNYDVILCERGIRTFETYTRNTMDISAIPIVKKLSHLPIIADPSHGTGRRDHVLPMARAAVAAGADGLLVEVHHDPDKALSDGAQIAAARAVP